MAQEAANPALLSPVSLRAPDYESHPRSPSHSPTRRQQFSAAEIDPLLNSLSPISTLEALRATDAVLFDPESRQNILAKSIADASASERALGIRAALAGKKLKELYTEVKEWHWPRERFEEPSQKDRLGGNSFGDHGGHLDRVLREDGGATPTRGTAEETYWGSLPARVVRQLQSRIEEIRDDMETLDVEELKDHVRGAYLGLNSTPSLAYGAMDTGSPRSKYGHLDDFTVIVTATIMQALPFITRLNALLDVWFVRVLVLQQVPGFLKRLDETQLAIDSAWIAIGESKETGIRKGSDLSRDAFNTMKSILQDGVADLGQKLDSMLDTLEGYSDRIPDHWIDKMEGAQEDYENWVVEAERQVEENEWRLLREQDVAVDVPVPIAQESGVPSPEVHTIEAPPVQEKSDTETTMRPVGATDGLEGTLAAQENDSLSQEKLIEPPEFSSTPADIEGGETQQSPKVQATEPVGMSTPIDEAKSENNINTPGMSEEAVRISSESELPESPSPLRVHAIEPLEMSDPPQTPTANILEYEPNSEKQASRISEAEKPDTELSNKQALSLEDIPTTVSIEASKPNNGQVDDKVLHPQNVSHGVLDQIQKTSAEPPKVSSHGSDGAKDDLRSPAHRPSPLDLKRPSERDVHVDLSPSASDSYSEMSSPEILDASHVQFFKSPTEEAFTWVSKDVSPTPRAFSRQSSQTTLRESTESLGRTRSILERNRSAFMASKDDSYLPKHNGFGDEGIAPFGPHILLKRASTTFIGAVPRGELKSITIKRSASSTTSRSNSPKKVEHEVPKPESGLTSLQPEAPLHGNADAGKSEPLFGTDHESQLPPLHVAKQRSPLVALAEFPSSSPPSSSPLESTHPSHLAKDADGDSLEHTLPVEDSTSSGDSLAPLYPDNRAPSPTFSIDDKLTARISSILTKLPARIRLTSGPGADAPEVRQRFPSAEPSTSGRTTPAHRMNRVVSSTPSMTLAPAFSKTSKSRSADSEIKLYHLHQPGKDAPIKLYVRLVGENGERVMVRVGGGWADLGEYLKEYATHHGRRAVSDGKFEIQGLPTAQATKPISAIISTPPTGRTTPTPNSRPSSPTFRPGSSLNIRKSRLSSASETRAPHTPEMPVRHHDITPGSADSYPSPYRSSSRLSWTDEDAPLGLAGPKSKKDDMSPTKKAWVDGMLDQARKASAEKKKSPGEFGELGKTGGTRRVFLKSKMEE